MCAHEGCRCEAVNFVREGRAYCSEACAQAAENPEGPNQACPCGHASCGKSASLAAS